MGLLLLSLALGIATTIGVVALLTILGRALLGASIGRHLPQVEGAGPMLQGFAGLAIIAIGLYTVWALHAQRLL